MEPGVARHPAVHDLAERDHELPRFLRRDDAGQRLLDQLVRPEAEEREHGVVGLVDLALEIRHKHRVRGVLDEALGVGAGLVELSHVAQDADRADDVAIRVSQGRRVERRRNHLARRATRLEPDVAGDVPLHDLAEGHHELPRLVLTEEPGDGLLENLVAAQTKQAGDGVVRLEDLALQIADEHRIRSIRDDDVRRERRSRCVRSGG